MYFYFRGRPEIGDELMQKFIEWRLSFDHTGLSKAEEEKVRQACMERHEYLFGKKMLDLPESEKQPFILAKIAERRQFLRSKTSWKKLKEDAIYG